MAHKKHHSNDQISKAFIQEICLLYNDCYDDRIEDSRPPVAGKKNGQAYKRLAGEDWGPGMPARHKSLVAFQRELVEKHEIHLSTSKIRKILISGGLWTTERSREIQSMFDELTREGSDVNPEQVVSVISRKLGVSKPTVVVNLPYINGVNRLEPKSKNAHRCSRYRAKKENDTITPATKCFQIV